MSGTRENPFMKKAQPKARDWYRIENAHVDEDGATDAVTKVYIFGEIGDSWWGESTSAADFVKQIATIKSNTIELHINSPGGSAFDGIAIYNALKQHDAEVHVVIDALAASAASFIAQAGDKVTMTSAAMMMIHDAATGAYGDAAYLRETADILDKLSNTVAGIYAKRSGESKEFWRNFMVQEVWFDADEAVASGLADEVEGDTDDEDLEEATNKWDLSIYNHAGRNAAPDPMELRRRIANQLKEEPVMGEENKEAGTPATTSEASPEVPPETPTTEGTNEDSEEREENQDGAQVTPPEAQPNDLANSQNRAFSLSINGQPVRDMIAVQNHINMLEQFRKETLENARKDFVTNLATQNKIGAPQVAKLTEFAMSLTDEGYAAWAGTWDDAPSLPMLGNHAGLVGSDGRQTEAGDTAAAELESAREIVNQHKMSGMKEEAIKMTASYKKLIEHDPNFKL